MVNFPCARWPGRLPMADRSAMVNASSKRKNVITRAVVPVAGMGSRLAPLTAAVPKALVPLVDAQGLCRPVIHWIGAEAAAAGISELAVVVSPWQREMLERYFSAAAGVEPALPARIEMIVQDRPLGFGEAVARAEEFAGGRDFLLMLGNHVYRSPAGIGECVRQVVETFDRLKPAAAVGMQAVGAAELTRVGVATGDKIDRGVYRCTAFVEKPSAATARRQLVTKGLAKGQYLAHCGLYAFSPAIFDCLREAADAAGNAAAELSLADAQSMMLAKYPQRYYLRLIAGRAWDVGTPEGLRATAAAFAQAARKDRRPLKQRR